MKFRFAVMGAGNIANKFCRAVSELEDCTVCAAASKSREKAEQFAAKNGIPAAYDNYEEMLIRETPDCVYIATTPDSHYALSMLCLAHKTPVLCEKAMFATAQAAENVFSASEKENIFTMEALWSRFLPANRQAREWLLTGRIGKPVYMDIKIGFAAPRSDEVRYFSPKLCGGATTDLTCYGYELARYYYDRPIAEEQIAAARSEGGVDASETVTLRYRDGVLATVFTTFDTAPDETAVLYGTEGKILIPHPHYANEAVLIRGGKEEEHFRDTASFDGFTYEIREAVSCIRAGKCESAVVPHRLTQDAAALYDRIWASLGLVRDGIR